MSGAIRGEPNRGFLEVSNSFSSDQNFQCYKSANGGWNTLLHTPTLVLCKTEIGKNLTVIPMMTVWLNFKIPTYKEREKWERMGMTVTVSEIFRLFEDKFVSIKDV